VAAQNQLCATGIAGNLKEQFPAAVSIIRRWNLMMLTWGCIKTFPFVLYVAIKQQDFVRSILAIDRLRLPSTCQIWQN
jgi:hypothetical protein